MPGTSYGGRQASPVRWSGRQAVAVLPGRFDVTNAGLVREGLLTAINRGAVVLLVDMTATLSCDHVGAEALVRVYRRAVANGTELQLVGMAPAVRRVIALSGLDRLVAVFPTLAARAASPPAAVSRLSVASPASLEQDARQGRQGQELPAALARLTGGVFDTGLTLQTALDRPAAGLRQAVEHALDLLDGVVREARAAAFACNDHPAGGRAGDNEPGTSGRPSRQAGAGRLVVAGGQAARPPELLALAAQETRARSRNLRARTLQAAALSAATQDRVAAGMSRLAAYNPRHAGHLRALSQAATGHATQMRQWAQDHPAAG